MERNYHATDITLLDYLELHKQTAFHEAGHAAAIYLGNKQKQLPPVFFEIRIKRPRHNNGQFFAKVVDGQLIQNLPIVIADNLSDLSNAEKHSYQCAYEADVMNLLVGPLAEAKYVAERDDEVFNQNLINTRSLKHYGGSSDVENAWSYLEHFIASKQQREAKMLELFNQAYQFINHFIHWRAIMKLAGYILDNEENTISCEEAISIFEQAPITR